MLCPDPWVVLHYPRPHRPAAQTVLVQRSSSSDPRKVDWTVVFGNLGAVQFATRTMVKVVIQPAPDDHTAAISERYPVIFSLG